MLKIILNLQPIERQEEVGNESLLQWLLAQNFQPDQTLFYIVGNNRLVSKLRRFRKEQGFSSSQIKVKGFGVNVIRLGKFK